MTRFHTTVRAADEHDVADLVMLWSELRRCGALHPRLATLTDDEKIADRVRRLLARPGCRIFVAALGDQPAGMAIVSTASLDALSEALCVQIEYTVVAEQFRRRGVGRALLSSALAYADEIGAEHITASVAPMSREANRFYAQVGLTPLAVRRVASVTALRRRLATIDLASGPRDPAAARRRPVASRTGVRAALRRIAMAPTVAEQPRDA